MEYKTLADLSNDVQSLFKIAEYLQIFNPSINTAKSYIWISGRDQNRRAFSNHTSISISFEGRIEVIRLMHRVNVFALVDFIRSLGYSA